MIDGLDLKIIQELQKNGRTSNIRLAKILGVVEGTIRKRVKHLLKKDIIRLVALPNVHRLGFNFITIMGLEVKMEDLRKVADSLAQKPSVCYLAFVTGRYDLIAIIVSRSPEELSHFIEKEISAIPSILRTETFVNLDVIKGQWPWIDTTQLIRNLNVSSPKEDTKGTE
jgi:Lrp/AsnC family transcriptional regulator for asnA, asnC and gidA